MRQQWAGRLPTWSFSCLPVGVTFPPSPLLAPFSSSFVGASHLFSLPLPHAPFPPPTPCPREGLEAEGLRQVARMSPAPGRKGGPRAALATPSAVEAPEGLVPPLPPQSMLLYLCWPSGKDTQASAPRGNRAGHVCSGPHGPSRARQRARDPEGTPQIRADGRLREPASERRSESWFCPSAEV